MVPLYGPICMLRHRSRREQVAHAHELSSEALMHTMLAGAPAMTVLELPNTMGIRRSQTLRCSYTTHRPLPPQPPVLDAS